MGLLFTRHETTDLARQWPWSLREVVALVRPLATGRCFDSKARRAYKRRGGGFHAAVTVVPSPHTPTRHSGRRHTPVTAPSRRPCAATAAPAPPPPRVFHRSTRESGADKGDALDDKVPRCVAARCGAVSSVGAVSPTGYCARTRQVSPAHAPLTGSADTTGHEQTQNGHGRARADTGRL